MNKRIKRWEGLFTVIGWLLIVLGVLSVIVNPGAMFVLIVAGMGSLLTGAVLDWMDDLLMEIAGTHEQQEEAVKLLRRLCGDDSAEDQEVQTPCEEESAEEEHFRGGE